jgi:hypothetical protein
VDCGSWYDYVRAWEKVRARIPQNRIYVSTYERMRADSEGEVARLAAFLGLETPRSLCRDIVEACSFERLKEASQKTKIQKSGPSFWKPGAQGIFRKGKQKKKKKKKRKKKKKKKSFLFSNFLNQ